MTSAACLGWRSIRTLHRMGGFSCGIAGRGGLPTIFAYGFRNPYRFSFDDGPGGTGALYMADVGQDNVEEIDIVTNGGNYGWVIKEGTTCFDPNHTTTPFPTCNDAGMI